MDNLSQTFQALADPTRRAILARLAAGDCSAGELAAPFAISQPAISRHLKVLERAGLISRSREAQYRPCRLEPQVLQEVDKWLAAYRQLWEARLDRLEAYLARLQSESPKSRKPKRKPRS
jgi:DNA-binding transcriptional ArsR family regulator